VERTAHKLSLARRGQTTRISAKQVAEIIGCSPKTALNRGAGTEELTRIRNGTRQIRFILEEVLAFAENQEKQAHRQPNNRQ